MVVTARKMESVSLVSFLVSSIVSSLLNLIFFLFPSLRSEDLV